MPIESLTRESVKPAMASLTIGSASAAVLLMHRGIEPDRQSIAVCTARTEHRRYELCHSGRDESVGGGMQPLMQTDAETLMHEGDDAGARNVRAVSRRNRLVGRSDVSKTAVPSGWVRPSENDAGEIRP